MSLMAVNLTESQIRKAVPIHGVSLELFGAQVGSIALARDMIKADWIKPNRRGLFDTGDIAACWVRMQNGEDPADDLKKGQ